MSTPRNRPENPDSSDRSHGRPARSARLPAREPDAGPGEVERLSVLLHEIRNLLDGSLRYVWLAQRSLSQSRSADDLPLTQALRQLAVATEAMERMSGLAHAAMQGPGLSIGSTLLAGSRPVSLLEAVQHAMDVVRPLADEHKVTLTHRVPPALAEAPAGPMYTVILNGLKNAVESVARVGGRGRVELSVLPGKAPRDARNGPDSVWMDLEILDEGAGVQDAGAVRRVFEQGLSARADGSGLGLAVARSVVLELGGHVDIRTRSDRSANDRRRGASFRVLAPLTNYERLNIGEER